MLLSCLVMQRNSVSIQLYKYMLMGITDVGIQIKKAYELICQRLELPLFQATRFLWYAFVYTCLRACVCTCVCILRERVCVYVCVCVCVSVRESVCV